MKKESDLKKSDLLPDDMGVVNDFNIDDTPLEKISNAERRKAELDRHSPDWVNEDPNDVGMDARHLLS